MNPHVPLLCCLVGLSEFPKGHEVALYALIGALVILAGSRLHSSRGIGRAGQRGQMDL